MALLYIHWNPDPILFSIAGIAIRWYSIFWVIAILAGSQVVYKLYQSKGLPVDTFQNLFLYSFLGIFIGARLGHCLFYEPDYYLLCITLIFLFRFFIEFLKERQVDFENVLPIDMGQILSIPFVLLGLYFVITKRKKAVR